MRAHLAALLAALGWFAAPAAQAREYFIAPHEMLEVYGTYPLSNGAVLRMGHTGLRNWAEIDGERIALRAVGPLTFVGDGGRLRLSFEALPFRTDVRVEGL
ncbi:MAG: hypothetical protein AB1584_02895 [Pseudomonadota bacterium]